MPGLFWLVLPVEQFPTSINFSSPRNGELDGDEVVNRTAVSMEYPGYSCDNPLAATA